MSDSGRPRSPFAGMADLSTQPLLRVLSRDKIERTLAAHRLYLETDYHQGHRANFASADLSGQDFTGTQLQRATLSGVISERARFDRADLTGARLSGANLVSARFENACLAKTDMEFALMAKATLRGACL